MQVNDLKIYQIACKLRDELHQCIKRVPRFWSIKSANQALGSSSSVSAIIIEGFSRRFRRKDYVHFLVMSLGSSDETQDHIKALFADGYFNSEDRNYFLKSYKDLSIRIVNYMNYQRNKFLTPEKPPLGPQ